MRKYTLAFAAFLFAACGDTVENVNQMGLDVVDSVADLPKCTSSNEGEQAFVKGEPTVRVCIEGEWFATASGDAGDFSCKTEELKDGSGLKIICNGDSIGVVLNGEKGDSGKDGKNGKDGEDGEDGKAGTGCFISDYTEATVTVVCGDSTMVLELGAGAGSDTLVLDSEKVAVSFESLAGYSQKGPFLKGSTVYLYELSDGRTLKQTNGNFTSIITRDDGRYKFTARDLVSQYAMIVVDGNYRNEVTGKSSEAPIRLRAITDMRKRSDANINLLTHLEFDRVYYLVTREKKTVKQAKTQAQKEIFAAFHIDTTDVKVSAEDLDVFGKTDADAALLAISVLLQGDGKMSKSKGNVIYADDLVSLFGVDAVRYFVLHEMPFENDGVITWEIVVERLNSELANTLGNLVNRTISMTNKYFGGVVDNKNVNTMECDEDLKKVVLETPAKVIEFFKAHS